MPILKGHLIAESPIYRGNGLKTLFSRKNKRDQTPIELPGKPESSDTGKQRMDAFMGFTNVLKNRKQYIDKLFDRLYKRLFEDRNNELFFRDIKIKCSFNDPRNKNDCFYDLRMGIKINRDRMSMEENANYKVETVFKGTDFDFSIEYPASFDKAQKSKLYLLLKELTDGRFWFGAGKTKGLGKISLQLDDISISEFNKLKMVDIPIKNTANNMEIKVAFKLSNPLLVGWQFNDEGEDDDQKTSEGYHRKIAGWMDQEIKNRQKHLEIKKQIASGTIKNWEQIKDESFKREHRGRDGRGIPLNRNSFEKAVGNDENLNHFLGWYRSKVQAEIEQQYNCDFRLSKTNNCVDKSKTPYDRIFMRMLEWKMSNEKRTDETGWGIYIPGGTIKGAFRIKAEKIMRTLLNQPLNNGQPTDDGIIGEIFGKQNSAGKIIFSDAYLTSDKKYCSLDSIQIDPRTGQPIKKAKMDFLYGYGKDFEFTTTFYLDDVKDDAVSGLFFYLLQDMKNGQIPLGGQKTSGMGWVKGEIKSIDIKTGRKGNILKFIPDFGKETQDGCWITRKGTLEQLEKTSLYKNSIEHFKTTLPVKNPLQTNPIFNCSANRKEISHAVFSGYSGTLSCNLTVLRPLHIKESGQPTIEKAPASQGWDFFHMGPPDNNSKPETREYAIPSKTLKGMIKSIYQLLSDKTKAESLFGFLDDNKGYMGRVNISFAHLNEGMMAWYGMSHHYSDLLETVHPKSKDGKRKYDLYKDVRIFKHLDFFGSSRVKKYPADQVPIENDITITPCRCAEKGSVFSFDLNFWNLQPEELKDLIASITLEEGMAHKMGKGKFLGFGSCKIGINFNQSTVYVVDKNTNHWRQKYTDPSFKPITFNEFFKNGYPKTTIPGELKALLEFGCE